MSIVVHNISKLYGSQKAVDDVSFDIGKGEIVGFIGPNGAGKSTTMKIICGYICATSGTVEVSGYDVQRNRREVSRRIGYLPEHNPLYLDMYVTEYLSFVAGLYRLGRNTGKRVADIVAATGLGSERHKKIAQLSKGYRQRVGLAQALIHDPEVLILDEPTTGLDPNQIIEIRSLISELGRSKTVLLSTHIMQEVEAICHRTVIIKAGKVVANATVTDMQHSGEGRTVVVGFNAAPSADRLRELRGVIGLRPLDNNRWLIYSGIGEDVRPELFRFAVDNGLEVLEMQQHERSLEEVFHELTATVDK